MNPCFRRKKKRKKISCNRYCDSIVEMLRSTIQGTQTLDGFWGMMIHLLKDGTRLDLVHCSLTMIQIFKQGGKYGVQIMKVLIIIPSSSDIECLRVE